MEILKYTKHSLEETHRTGIYLIVNLVNQRFYIGSTSVVNGFPSGLGFRYRWGHHISDLIGNRHDNKPLQNAWNKYGSSNFDFRIIEFVEPELCIEVEQIYLDTCIWDLAYNICPIAGSCKGVKRSEESRRNQSERLKGTKFTEERKEKIRLANTGVVFSEERKQNISDAKSKTYTVYSPEGEKIEIVGLKRWCKENSISAANLSKVLKGKLSHAKGYTASPEAYQVYREAYERRGIHETKGSWYVEIQRKDLQRRYYLDSLEDSILKRDEVEIEFDFEFKVMIPNFQERLEKIKGT